MTKDDIIAALDLSPHPEGGWYRQTWVADANPGERAAGTAIYYLLGRGEVSALHRIDSAEVWHFYAGDPLEISIGAQASGPFETQILGPDLAGGARPQIVVPPNHWQSARPLGEWGLVGCTVSPGFSFEFFELA